MRAIENAVRRIDQVPLEKQRPILKELIHNVEIHPLKLRIEIYVPIPETQKATGTDVLALNLKTGSLIPFEPSRRRVGSSTVDSGTRDRT